MAQKQRKMSEKSLANLRPFKKGQSGNPAGRPKGASVTSRILAKLAAEDGKTADELAERIIELAKGGDMKALIEIIERADGKTTHRIGGPDGEPLWENRRITEGIDLGFDDE